MKLKLSFSKSWWVIHWVNSTDGWFIPEWSKCVFLNGSLNNTGTKHHCLRCTELLLWLFITIFVGEIDKKQTILCLICNNIKRCTMQDFWKNKVLTKIMLLNHCLLMVYLKCVVVSVYRNTALCLYLLIFSLLCCARDVSLANNGAWCR